MTSAIYKQTSKCNTDWFGRFCQLWSVTLNCKRDSKPRRCVQQHKSLKLKRNAKNRNKHINEASKQTFANILFKILCTNMQNMLSDWKICLKIINISTYDKSLSNLRKISENVQFTTCTNFLFWSQQITKTISKYNTDSFGPICQLWFVTLERMRNSKPQRCIQPHKSLKVPRNATNWDQHKNEAS